MYDYSKLKGRIVEIYGTQGNFAEALGIAKTTLSLKLGNRREFTQKEITRAIMILYIENPIPYFFTKEVNTMVN